MTEKPKLIVSGSGKGELIYYICSHCSRGFSLADNQPPKQAVRELYHRFLEHVEHEHLEPAAGPNSASVG
jgi:hypothetical protein